MGVNGFATLMVTKPEGVTAAFEALWGALWAPPAVPHAVSLPLHHCTCFVSLSLPPLPAHTSCAPRRHAATCLQHGHTT